MVVREMNKQQQIYTVAELAEYVNGEVYGKTDQEVTGVSGLEQSTSRTLTFAEDKKHLSKIFQAEAGAVIVPRSFRENIQEREQLDYPEGDGGKTLILVDNPRLAYARIAGLFVPEPYYRPGIHPSAVVSASAELGEDVSLHPQVVVGDNCRLGEGVVLAPGVKLGNGVEIGDNSVLHPNVVVEFDCKLGSEVIIHSGTIIGSDGYGFVTEEGRHYKIPQLGQVIIEDRVEIGASVTIDRGTSGPTVIGEGTKVDNLVQIAHNVRVGANCLLVAQVGIAGSTELADGVTLAGQVGVAGHLKINQGATIAAKSLVSKEIPPGVFYSGIPAQEHSRELRQQASRRRLPDLITRVRRLEQKLD